MIIDTPRLRLRPWREADRDAFAALNDDPEVARDLGGPLSRAASDAKLDRYIAAFHERGFCRWAIETRRGEFLGYTGVMPSRDDHPLYPHCEVGWRLKRSAWGQGYATESAKAALEDGFARVGLTEVLSYTAADNRRSQAAMHGLNLICDVARDFTLHDERLGLGAALSGWRCRVDAVSRVPSPSSTRRCLCAAQHSSPYRLALVKPE